MTDWARERLTQLISEASFVVPTMPAIIDVTKVRDVEGDASVTLSRGKKRCVSSDTIFFTNPCSMPSLYGLPA